MRRRTWVVATMAGVVVVAGVVAWTRTRDQCGSSVTSVSAARSSSPFLDAADRKDQPDVNRDTLVRTLAADPAPVGQVVGAVGYHYEQWAQVSGFAQGIGVRTRDNPDFTMLDDTTLKPRWSVQVGTRRSAYDASDKRYLVAAFPLDGPAELVALNATTGHRIWCSTLGGPRITSADPFATQILDDQDVVALGPGAHDDERLARLDHADGSREWSRTLQAGEGDFLGELGDGKLLVGGVEQPDLFDPQYVSQHRAGTALALVSAENGHTLWTRRTPAGAALHVVGTDGGTAVLQERDSTTKAMRLTAVDGTGRQLWSATPGGGASFDAALRAGRVLVRHGSTLAAYDVETGHRLWARELPTRPQFLPYGFELGEVPLLDEDHALIGSTTALRTLDLRTGAMTSAALPTDGINTTYWPYELAISPGLIAIATNTGAVVVRRK